MKRVVSNGPRLLLALSLMGGMGVAGAALAPAAFAQSFLIGPDDVLAVQVINHPEMSAATLPVGANGKIALPLVGDLTVGGKTVAQAQIAIAQVYRSQLRSPQVTVSVVTSRPRQVVTLGAVTKPGPVDIGPGWRVSEILAAVGGTLIPLEDTVATLTRGKKAPVKLDLVRISASPQSAANIPLYAGDVINVVPVTTVRVTVGGDVVLPNVFPLRRSPRVIDAILAAGGLKGQPSETRATIIRAGNRIPVDLPAVYESSASPANVLLRDGDYVSIETIKTNVSVVSFDNLVKMPGNYPLVGDASVLRAIFTAGGLTTPADKVMVSIRRGATIMPVDLQRAAYDPSQDLPMREGDVLLVSQPDGPQVNIMGGVGAPGVRHLKEGATLMDAIVDAGGMTLKPEAVRLHVLRTLPGGKQVNLSIDPVALFNLRDLGQNLRLQNGDLIILNEDNHTQNVFVSGEVVSPGAIVAGPGDGLTEIILRAGGPTKLAWLSHVNVTHSDGTSSTVDLGAILQPNGAKVKLPVQQGDIVVVPRNPHQVLVMNAVMSPGYQAVPESGVLTLGDALLAAGGVRPDSNLSEVTILRPGANGAVQRQVVAVNAVRSGKLTINVPLQSGDVVFVPNRSTSVPALTQVTRAITTFSLFSRFAAGF